MRIRFLAFALALTLAFSAGAANADVALTFNDVTDTTSVTVSGGSATVVALTPEDLLVILPVGTLSAPLATNSVFGLTEAGATGFSDLIYFTAVPGTTALSIEFVSNTDGVALIPQAGWTLFGSAAETGAVQSIPLPPGVTGVTVSVQSSLEVIPEPSILALAGTGGFLGLGFWGYRRRKA